VSLRMAFAAAGWYASFDVCVWGTSCDSMVL
jgi:hypothetical protein